MGFLCPALTAQDGVISELGFNDILSLLHKIKYRALACGGGGVHWKGPLKLLMRYMLVHVVNSRPLRHPEISQILRGRHVIINPIPARRRSELLEYSG